MVKKILKWSAAVLAAVLSLISVSLLVVWLFRSDPRGPMPGKRLSAAEVAERVDDWSFSDEHLLLQIESRPENPYSVNITFLTHQGQLYVVCVYAEESRWGRYLQVTPEARLRIDGRIYPGRATLVEEPVLIDELIDPYAAKYPSLFEDSTQEEVERFWYFRVDSTS